MSGLPHVGDALTWQVTFLDQAGVVKDISAATVKRIKFRKPDDTEVEKDGTFVTDGTDGKLKYKSPTSPVFVDLGGLWKFQGHVVVSGDPFTGGDADGQPLTVEVMEVFA